MSHKQPKAITWFEQQNRRHITFLVAVGLIGLLFIAAIIGILSGRFKPFADTNTPSQLKLKQVVTITNGKINYSTTYGDSKGNTVNDTTVTVKAISHSGITLQGVGNNIGKLAQVTGKLTVAIGDKAVDDPSSLRNVVWSTTTHKSDSQDDLALDSDTFRDFGDANGTSTTYTVTIKPDYFLAKKNSGISNLRQLGDVTYSAGDLNNDNKVDVNDLAVLAKTYGQSTDANNPSDMNKDGKVDVNDLAVLAQSYGKSGDTF